MATKTKISKVKFTAYYVRGKVETALFENESLQTLDNWLRQKPMALLVYPFEVTAGEQRDYISVRVRRPLANQMYEVEFLRIGRSTDGDKLWMY